MNYLKIIALIIFCFFSFFANAKNTNIDILNVMKQYEHIYPNFEFIGPSPIDYDTHLSYGECVWEELCKFNLQNNI